MRGVKESTVLGLTDKLKTLENPTLGMINYQLSIKAPFNSPSFSGTISFDGCTIEGLITSKSDLGATLNYDFKVINDPLDNLEMARD